MSSIGRRIKVIAKYCGSAAKLAQLLVIDPGNLNKYANDINKPGADLLVKFHNIGFSTDWLLTGEGEMLLDRTKPQREQRPAEVDMKAEINNLKREISRINKKLNGAEFNTLVNFSERLKAAEPASTYDGGGIKKKK